MKKTKIYKTLCLVTGLGIALSGVASQAASITKTLKAVYNNIAITYNGEVKKLSAEPFTVDGTTYVPLRAIGEIMGAEVNWANNTVQINAQTKLNTAYEQEIAAKNYENALLKQQLEMAKKELQAFTGTDSDDRNLTTTAIDSTLSKIKSTYKDTYNVAWDFQLKNAGGRLELTVVYDSRYDESDFDKIKQDKREQFVKEMCYDIAQVHQKVEIRGALKDNRNNLERAAFRYTQSGLFEYTETAHFSLTNLEKELEKEYKVINYIGFSIPINAIQLEKRDQELTFILITSLRPSGTTNDYRTNWNNLSSDNKKELEQGLKKIKEDILLRYSGYDTISGAVRDASTGNTIAVYQKDGKLYLSSVNTN